jgi:hypothetical protein
MKHLFDTLVLISYFALIIGSLKGWGLFLLRLVASKNIKTAYYFDVWLGLLCAVFYAEVVNFMTPITWEVTTVFYASGLLFAMPRFLAIVLDCRIVAQNLYAALKRNPLEWALLVFVGFVCISKAMIPSLHFDVDLYYVQSVKWLNEYSTPFGLGNLHTRLGFNQSLFSFAALLNLGSIWGHGLATCNLFILVLVVCTLLSVLDLTSKTGRHLSFLLLLVFLEWIYSPDSPSPDQTVGLLQIALFVISGRLLIGSLPDYEIKNGEWLVCQLLVVCALSVMVKLSAAPFVVGLIIVLASKMRDYFKASAKAVICTLVVTSSALLIHAIRGYVLTGYPMYPIAFLGLNEAPWALSLAVLDSEAKWIFSWARQSGAEPALVLGNWNWLYSWIARTPLQYWLISALTGVSLICGLLIKCRRVSRTPEVGTCLALIYIPLFVAMMAWFLSAPDWRFAGALPELFLLLSLWLLYFRLRVLPNWDSVFTWLKITSCTIAIVLCSCTFLIVGGLETLLLFLRLDHFYHLFPPSEISYIVSRTSWKIVNFGLILIFFLFSKEWVAKLGLPNPAYRLLNALIGYAVIGQTALVMGFFWGDLQGWRASIERPYSLFETKSGAIINVATSEGRCGDAPLPCTPLPNANLAIPVTTPAYKLFYVQSERKN